MSLMGGRIKNACELRIWSVGAAQDVLACIELDSSELKTRVTVLRKA